MKIAIKDVIIKTDRQRQDMGDIESLAGSMARTGLINPIILTDANELVAGERRIRAAMYNGWEDIEFRVVTGLTPLELEEIELEENLRRKDLEWTEEVKAVRRLFNMRQERYGVAQRGGRTSIADKMMAGDDAGYSLERAAEELERGKSSIHFDIQLAGALDEFPEIEKEATKAAAWRRYRVLKETSLRAEIARRTRNVVDEIAGAEEGNGGQAPSSDSLASLFESQEGEPVPAPATQEAALGKLFKDIKKATWRGKGVLYNTDAVDFLRHWPENSVDLCVTDPPFGLGMFKGGSKTGGGRLTEAHGDMYDDDPHAIMDMLDQVFGHLRRVVKDEGQLYVFFHMSRYEKVYLMLREHFGEAAVDETPIVWIKNTPGIGDPQKSWVYAYEPVFHVNRGGRFLCKPQAFNYIKYDTVPPGQKIHPMAKPPALLRHFISASAIPGEVVLDPFAGSGSTLMAATQLGCRFIGVEKHEPFYRAATEGLAEVIAEVDAQHEAPKEVSDDEVPPAV